MGSPYLRDPDAVEFKHLRSACRLAGSKLLEIGCGNGCLTWQYAGLCGQVVGLDPNRASLLEAQGAKPAPVQNTTLIQAKAQEMPFSSQSFDIVLFASSL